MKKIMILGGSKYIIPVIKKAHKLGIYVITCDYLPSNYAHKYADEYVNVSIVDKNKVLKIAKKLNIDGIISFACDPGVTTACYVAEKLKLPNVGPYESICILQNKYKFRTFLKKNNFNVPFFKEYKNIEDIKNDLINIPFPVVIKPTDSAGSKGVSKVVKPNALVKAAQIAFENSLCKEVIIEQFIEPICHPSDADSFIYNGDFVYFGLSSQLFDKGAANPFTPSGYFWPSQISMECKNSLKTELSRLFKLLKLETCILNIEVRVGLDGKPYIMEVSPRGGGNRLSEMIEFGTGIDFISEYLKYSVGINCKEYKNLRQINFSNWCEIILHSRMDGKFNNVIISDHIKDYLVENDVWIKRGDKINKFTGANQTIGTLIFHFKEYSEMIEMLNDIDKNIKITLL